MTDHSHLVPAAKLERAQWPHVELGLSSVILGVIGLVLFIVPIIAIPISIAGILVGAVGIVVALVGGQERLRFCVAGVLLAMCGLAILLAIARAPSGYFSPRSIFPTVQPVKFRPYVPPPALPQSAIWLRE